MPRMALGGEQRPVEAVEVFVMPVQPDERPNLVGMGLGKGIGVEDRELVHP